MTESLAPLDLSDLPEYIPLPKGCTRRQFKLARLILTARDDQSRADLMKEAGYSEVSAYASASKLIERSGTQRAIAVIQEWKADNARDLKRKAEALLYGGVDALDLKSLDAKEKIALGGSLLKLLNELGMSDDAPIAKHSAGWYRSWIRRGLERAKRIGAASALRSTSSASTMPSRPR